ncbi:hypothetical protein FCM35_KLT02980 [Carex littledalei]|uniref:Uncharacterized protein n=1 Tax=Carex littledalei TaxID=544730 RepID=A0A833VR20_9POAL|nr:hypothetical protein FCM35_KLT02980 [Carex littledalei]
MSSFDICSSMEGSSLAASNTTSDFHIPFHRAPSLRQSKSGTSKLCASLARSNVIAMVLLGTPLTNHVRIVRAIQD